MLSFASKLGAKTHTEACGEHGPDLIRNYAHYRIGILAKTTKGSPAEVFEQVAQELVDKFGKRAKHFMLDKKTVADKVCTMRRLMRGIRRTL